jgi:hypothetical protein
MDDYGIGCLLLLGEIDITGVISLVVAGIVHILPLLRGLQFHLGSLKTSESACRLGHSYSRKATHTY